MSDASTSGRGFGYWLNIFANIAVVGGIVFLGIEIRQNSDMMTAQTRNELAAGSVELLTFAINDADFVNTILRGHRGEDLSDIEQYQYRQRTNAWFRYWENVHYQYRNGLYDEIEYGVQREAIRGALFASVGFATYWCARRSLYSPEFVEEIDGLLATYRC